MTKKRLTTIRTIARKELDPNNLYGFVLGKNSELTYLILEYDFKLDGYQIIRTDDLTTFSTSDTNKYCAAIMKREGLLKDYPQPAIQLDSWHTVFQSLKKMDFFIIVEDENEDDFMIGPIVRVNKQSVTIRYFDSVGEWKDAENIRYEDITSVKFGDNYSRMHQKYIDEEL